MFHASFTKDLARNLLLIIYRILNVIQSLINHGKGKKIHTCGKRGAKMKSNDVNTYYEKLQKKMYSREECILELAEFISQNYPVFGTSLFDEDLRSEVILMFLEKGKNFLSRYNPLLGDFFTYFYGYIMNTIFLIKKNNAKKLIAKSIVEKELEKLCQISQSQIAQGPALIPVNSFASPRVPYRARKITFEELREGLQLSDDCRTKKAILSLTLKASFYITEELVYKISNFLELKAEILIEAIELIKKDLENKRLKKEKFDKSRNNAYTSHLKLEKEIQLLKDEIKVEHNSNQLYTYEAKIEKLDRDNHRQIDKLSALNEKYINGIIALKPSNAVISDITGICERQISYYLFCARKGKLNLTDLLGDIDSNKED